MSIAQGSAHLAAKSRRGQAIGSVLHQISTANDITAGGSEATAQILNQGAGHNIRAHLRGLLLLDKLAVAVVHISDDIRISFLGGGDNATNLLHANGLTQAAIATGALNMHHLSIFGHSFFHCFQIHMLTAHRQLFVGNAQIHQTTLGLHRVTNNGLHGVVGSAGEADQLVPRTQIAQQRHSQSMGTADELGAHQGCLRLKNFRVNQIQGIASHIAIAIAGGGLEIIIANHLIAESGNNLFSIHQSRCFQLRGMLGHLGQGICFYCLIIYCICQILHLLHLFFKISLKLGHLLGLHPHLEQGALS